MRQEVKDWIIKHKVWIASGLTILLIIFIIFGAKIWLYFGFILGNDLIVKLDVDNQNIELVHGQEEIVQFQAKATTNPFCSALCNSYFTDISNNKIIEKRDFKLRPGNPFDVKYTLKSPNSGTGLNLYRFDLECYSVESILCHTKGKTSTRSIMITVKYDLSEDEKALKTQTKEELDLIIKDLSELKGEQTTLKNTLEILEDTLILDNLKLEFDKLGDSLDVNSIELQKSEITWKKQDYSGLAEQTDFLKSTLRNTKNQFQNLNENLTLTTETYNNVIEDAGTLEIMIKDLKEIPLENLSLALELNNLINKFNQRMLSIKQIGTLDEKQKIIRELDIGIEETGVLIEEINYNCLNIVNLTCTPPNITIINPSSLGLDKIETSEMIPANVTIKFDEPKPKCCVFGDCFDCCIEEE